MKKKIISKPANNKISCFLHKMSQLVREKCAIERAFIDLKQKMRKVVVNHTKILITSALLLI